VRPLTHRADLLRIAASLGRDALVEAARGLGFEAEAPATQSPQGPSTGTGEQRKPRRPLPAPRTDEPSIPFWQPCSIEIDDEATHEQFVRRIETSEEAAEARRPWERGDALPPATTPLSPWRRTGPLLQRALTAGRAGRRLDIPGLVRRWCRGEHIRELPRRERRAWVPVVVLVDRSLRLVPFWDDQDALVGELADVLGTQGCIVRCLPDGPIEPEETARSWRTPTLCGVPVLALGDLGWYGGADDRDLWLRLGRALRRGGQRIHALVPVSRGRWTDELARTWHAMPWERPAPGSQVPLDARAREARVNRLLRLLGPAMRIEPGLIRTLRLLLPREAADAGTEADLWARPELGEPYPEYRAFLPERADAFRREFLRARDLDHRAVMAALRAWHWNEGRQPEAWHLEVLALARAKADLAGESGIADALELLLTSGDEDLERAQAFMVWLAGEVRTGSPDTAPDDRSTALRAWCRFVGGQEQALWSSRTPAGRALQLIGNAVGGVEIPDMDPRLRALVGPPRPKPRPHVVMLHQVGGWIEAVIQPIQESGSPIATVIAAEPLIHVVGPSPTPKLDLSRPGGRLAAPPRGPIELRTDRATLRLEPLTKPAWARAIGRDRFGLWAELIIKGVPYRMRWIPPGRFIMGSPPDEPGRDYDEKQHPVVITRGYWLGETPVTQALWQAVTGENPSRFQTPDRPVEQVSWHDCHLKLITRLIREFPSERGEGFRLPTEAEWEYACRAGTTMATYAGPIEILGANNAPMLDAIAWYGGNSGEKFDKQHPHSEAGTRRVRGKLPNQWGLYDMLGNVWEWCSDWISRSDRSATQQDPTGPATGEGRVVRGGSWDDHARFVRAACRLACAPGLRDSALGLRLARGQGPAGPVGPESERDARQAGRAATIAAVTRGRGMVRARETIGVGAVSIELSSQDKVMFPDDGITKGDLVTYYLEMAATMLPYIEGRPMTVQRFTSGIGRPGFVQKEAGEHYPDWIPRVAVPISDGRATTYPLIEDAAALVYLVNQNCIVFHPAAVRRERLAYPDLFIMDLDPSDNDFNKVRQGALLLREMLQEIGLVPYVKTTGSRGLHVVAPIVPEENADVVVAFARTLAERLCRRAPDTFTIEIAKKKRGDRVFVDYLRNGYLQTAVAPYSLRAIAGAPAATPLAWAELDDPGLTARSYHLRNMAERLRKVEDPWRGLWRQARSLIAAREKMG